MNLPVKRIVHSMINTEASDGNGSTTCNAEIVHLDIPDKLREALQMAKEYIEFIPCADVSQLKLNQIDEHLKYSPRREIARVCKNLFSMKVPHGQRKWGIGLTPRIQEMLLIKSHRLIDGLLVNAYEASHYYKKIGLFEMEFTRYVGHLVSAAIQLLPSSREDIMRVYNEIWIKREKDRMFPTNNSQKSREDFHAYCLRTINELELDERPMPIASLTLLEASGFSIIQKMHWRPDILVGGKITSRTQKIAYKAYAALQRMAVARTNIESREVNKTILYLINDVEITRYWIALLNSEFNTYQQMTYHDWSRLMGIEHRKTVEMIDELFAEFKRDENRIELKLAFLRLVLPLVEPWVLCVMLERNLNKKSISRHISIGLNEYKQYLSEIRPDLLSTFNKLKQFTRPYGKSGKCGKCGNGGINE